MIEDIDAYEAYKVEENVVCPVCATVEYSVLDYDNALIGAFTKEHVVHEYVDDLNKAFRAGYKAALKEKDK